jgi:8-oxo-dGTP diphosphatase
MIGDYALLQLRAKLGYTAIAFCLLPASFSLSELQNVYEAVLDYRVEKRNFRRKMQAAGVLDGTGGSRREGSHRPARLYRFRASQDAEANVTPGWATGPEQETANL